MAYRISARRRFQSGQCARRGNARTEWRETDNLYRVSLRGISPVFDIARTEKSTAIQFDVHSIEINFPPLHKIGLPEEGNAASGANVRQKEAFYQRRYKSRGMSPYQACAILKATFASRPAVPSDLTWMRWKSHLTGSLSRVCSTPTATLYRM